jgi:hypothetical protein
MTEGITSRTVLGAVRAGADGVWQQPTRIMSSSDRGERDGVHTDTTGRAGRIH